MKKILLILFICISSNLVNAQICIGVTGGLSASKTNVKEEDENGVGGANSFEVKSKGNAYYGFMLTSALGTRGRLNLHAGFNVMNKGYKTETVIEDPSIRFIASSQYDVKTFEIPLYLRLVIGRPNVGIDPYILGGGYLGINRSAKYNMNLKVEDAQTGEELSSEDHPSDHKPYDEKDLDGSNPFPTSGRYLSNQKDMGYLFGGGFAFNLVPNGAKIFIEAKSSRSFKGRSLFVDGDGKTSDPTVRNQVFYLSAGLLIPIFSPASANADKNLNWLDD